MELFIYTDEIPQENIVVLLGDEFKHAVRVVRKKIGDEFHCTNGRGTLIKAQIKSIHKDHLLATILEKNMESAPASKISIAVGILKSMERYEVFLQKAVELGVTDIYPMFTERTISQPKETSTKIHRWEKIITSACKQCRKIHFPTLHAPQKYSDLIQATSEQIILYYEFEHEYREVKDINKNVSIFIGPEGGFTEEEKEHAVKKGAIISGLGKEILRTETAAILAISIIKIKKLFAIL